MINLLISGKSQTFGQKSLQGLQILSIGYPDEFNAME
jgi:hypothetical protein